MDGGQTTAGADCGIRQSRDRERQGSDSVAPELVRRLLIRALQSQDAHIAPRGETVDRALETLATGGKLTVGDLLCTGGTLWHIEPAPLRSENR